MSDPVDFDHERSHIPEAAPGAQPKCEPSGRFRPRALTHPGRILARDGVRRGGTLRRVGALLIVTGPPGAGKSTVAALLAAAVSPSVLVEGDRFHGFLAAGAIAPWLPESNDQNTIVVEASALATGAFVRGGYFTVFDGMIGAWFLPTFLRAARLDEADTVDYVVVMPTVEIRMVGAKCLFADRERALVERLGVGVAALLVIEQRQVVEARRHIRTVQHILAELQTSRHIRQVRLPPRISTSASAPPTSGGRRTGRRRG